VQRERLGVFWLISNKIYIRREFLIRNVQFIGDDLNDFLIMSNKAHSIQMHNIIADWLSYI